MKKLRVMVIQVLFLYMNSVIKPIFVCVVIGSFVELMNYVGSKKYSTSAKTKAFLFKFKQPIAVMLYSS